MYKRGDSVQVKSSASILCNNLDVFKSSGKLVDECKLAVIHKSLVWVFVPKEVKMKQPTDGALPYKQVHCKGENMHSSSNILQVSSFQFFLRDRISHL